MNNKNLIPALNPNKIIGGFFMPQSSVNPPGLASPRKAGERGAYIL